MSQKTDLQSNNVDLQSILATINALPEAGGGGGAEIETCTVRLNVSTLMGDPVHFIFMCVVYENGVVKSLILPSSEFDEYGAGGNNFINIENVVLGTVFWVSCDWGFMEAGGIGAEMIFSDGGGEYAGFMVNSPDAEDDFGNKYAFVYLTCFD